MNLHQMGGALHNAQEIALDDFASWNLDVWKQNLELNRRTSMLSRQIDEKSIKPFKADKHSKVHSLEYEDEKFCYIEKQPAPNLFWVYFLTPKTIIDNSRLTVQVEHVRPMLFTHYGFCFGDEVLSDSDAGTAYLDGHSNLNHGEDYDAIIHRCKFRAIDGDICDVYCGLQKWAFGK